MNDFKAFIERLKDKTAGDLPQIIGETGGLTPRRAGRYWTTEEHDSLSIDPERGWYEWYSKAGAPGSRGDVFEWLQYHGGIPDFMEAVRWLSDRAGLRYEWSEEQAERYAARKRRLSAQAILAEFLHRLLLRGGADDAPETLAAGWAYALSRGWSEETIRQARLGFWHWDFAGELRKELRMHEVDLERPEVVAVLGYSGNVAAWAQKYDVPMNAVQNDWLTKDRAPGMPPNLLVYPHFYQGKCIYFSGRRIDWTPDDRWGKGWNARRAFMGKRQPYWNWVNDPAYIVVVEGQADAISLGQWDMPAVALAGATADEELIALLKKREKVVLSLDSDPAGAAGTRALAETLGPATPIVSWPLGKDVNDLLQEGWKGEDIRGRIHGADIFAMWAAKAWRAAPADKADKARRYAFEVIAQLMPYEYATWASKLALALDLTSESGAARVSDLNKITKAIRTERDLAASGVEEAQPILDAPRKKTMTVAASAEERWPELEDEKTREILMGASRDHEGHARCAAALYGERLAFVPGVWGWLHYNGKYWQRDAAEHQAQRLVVRTLKMRRFLGVEYEVEALVKSTRASRGNVTGTQSLLEKLVLAETTDFDTNPDMLNVDNGVLDLRTGELKAHDVRNGRFTYCIPYPYEPGADFTEWLTFLGTVTGARDQNDIYHVDTEMLDWLQMAVGYSLTGHTSEACVFYLYGPTRAGKGAFTQTLQKLLGKPLAAGIDFQVLTANREADSQNFAFAPLKPCRIIVGSEPGKYERFNEATLKLLTGEDTIRCSFKRQDHFEYEPQFKIWLSSNWPFNADPNDDAAWGRARVIHFPNSFLGREDKRLKERLQADGSMRGILAWAVEGAKRWYRGERGLGIPPAVAAMTQKQRSAQDYIQQFLDECCAMDSDAFVSSRDLYKAYKKWCEGELTPMKNRSFSLGIQAKGLDYGRSYVELDQSFMDDNGHMRTTKQVRGYHGLELNAVGHDYLISVK
jgi:putative DNA primase/helicase